MKQHKTHKIKENVHIWESNPEPLSNRKNTVTTELLRPD